MLTHVSIGDGVGRIDKGKQDMQFDERRRRYLSLFGDEPVTDNAIEQIESLLGVVLPEDFKDIASFYSGGIVGGISLHATATSGQADNISQETKTIRAAMGLPFSMVVLAEPPASLIVLDTNAHAGFPAVIWLDATDVRALKDISSLRHPQTWSSYAEFFDFLLERELEERGEAN